jgi:hypothetical protein
MTIRVAKRTSSHSAESSTAAVALSAVAMLFLGRYPDFEVPEQVGGADLLPSANASP